MRRTIGADPGGQGGGGAPWAQLHTISLGAASVVTHSHGSLPIDLQTAGIDQGGHVYSQYQVDYTVDSNGVPIGPEHFGGSAGPDSLTIGATELVVGDHPVTVPEPAVVVAFGLSIFVRRRNGRAG